MKRALLALALCFSACIKKPPVGQDSLGSEVAEQTISDQISKALNGTTPLSMQVGQMAHTELNMRVSTGDITKEKDEVLTVAKRSDDSQNVTFDYVDTETDYTANGQTKTIVTESKDVWPKNPGASPPPALTASAPVAALSLIPNANTTPILKTTYHSLQTRSVSFPVPDAILNKPNCLGLIGCEIEATELDYVEADWTSTTDYNKSQWQLTLSPQVPFLARRMNACLTQLVPYDGTKILVTQCLVIRDFEFKTRP